MQNKRNILSYLPVLDDRSLSAFRIVIGLVLILDLLVFRFSNIEAFYTDEGILSRELAKMLGNGDGYTALTPFSPLFINGSFAFVFVFFILALFSYSMLLVGYRSRIAAILSFVFLISIHHRSSIVVETDDRMLLCVLFWAIFLPLGNYFSVDSFRKAKKEVVSRWASMALLIQVALIYFCNGFTKTGETWNAGTAVQYAMQEDLWIRQGPASWLAGKENLCQWITVTTGPFEILLAFAIVFIGFSKIRLLISLLILAFHWGIAVFLSFGFLPLIATAWAVAILPSRIWSRFSIYSSETKVSNQWTVKHWLLLPVVIICFWQSFTHMQWMIKLPSFLPKALSKTSLLHQSWLLYAPDVNKTVGWMQLKGITSQGKELELHSQKEWTEDGSLIKYYQHECWQNFQQYQLYRQPYTKEITQRWLEWSAKKSTENGITLDEAQVIKFTRRLNLHRKSKARSSIVFSQKYLN